MTASFQRHQWKVKDDPETAKEVKIIKMDQTGSIAVREFSFNSIARDSADVKARAVDASQSGGAKANRFSMNQLQKHQLGLDADERQAVEDEIERRVAEQKEQARKAGQEQGYKAGYEQGFQEAHSKFLKEGETRTASLDQMIALMEAAKAEVLKNNEKFIIEMVFRIAKTLALRDISVQPDYVARVAREVIERIGLRDNIRIRVHPKDIETAIQMKKEFETTIAGIKNIMIEPSDRVLLGGCVLETEWNAIDARIETQLKQIYEALEGPLHSSGGETQGDGGENTPMSA